MNPNNQQPFDECEKNTANRMIKKDIDGFLEIAKALSTEIRTEIFKALLTAGTSPMNVSEIAEHFKLPMSTIATNVKKLEEAGLIRTDIVPGSRGAQKVCSVVYSGIFVDFANNTQSLQDADRISMPIGNFTDCSIEPSCGLVGEEKIIGEYDHPASFYDPERVNAQLLWFRHGYVEYRFPNNIKDFSRISCLEFSMEVCSEAPLYKLDWPSDITVWVNGVDIGTWTSLSDFGGERGILTPKWWGEHNTQFGIYKTWSVNNKASFVDGKKVSDVTLKDIIKTAPYITVRIGIKKDAVNEGGINIFGKKFGNYETDLLLSIIYKANDKKE